MIPPAAKSFCTPTRAICLLLSIAAVSDAQAQNQVDRVTYARQQARAKMQPIGSPSAIDRYRKPQSFQRQDQRFAQPAQQQGIAQRERQAQFQETAFNRPTQATIRPASDRRYDSPGGQSAVRQVVMMQEGGFAVPTLPPGSPLPGIPPGANPGANSAIAPNGIPAAPSQVPDPTTGRTLPLGNSGSTTRSPSDLPGNTFSQNNVRANDLNPVGQPQLQSNGFATVDNCNCVSGPSGYSAASGLGCGSNFGFVAPANFNRPLAQQFVAPPAQIAAPAAIPTQPVIGGGAFGQAGLGTGLGTGLGAGVGNVSPPRALVSLGQQLNPVQVGQGLWGQPVAYVPGQSVRNWIRYFFP